MARLQSEHTAKSGWVVADVIDGFHGWTCCVEQGAYGHKARKATWLYASDVVLPVLRWGRAPGQFQKLEESYRSAAARKFGIKKGIIQRLSHRARAATPVEFRDLLLEMARSVERLP